MQHIYRQITALERFRPVVLTQKREEAERYPFDPVICMRRPRTRFLQRFWFKKIRSAPWRISRAEADDLQRILERERAELLHVFFGHIAVHLLPLMRLWPGPTVVSFHGADVMVDMDKPAYRAATQEMLAAARLVFVRSRSLCRALVDLGCPETKIRIQRTGIPLGEIQFRERTWPQNGRWRLLQACRLIPKKGLHTSLLAFAEFAKQHPAATLTIAGEGPMRDELDERARALGISGKLFFTGFITQANLRQLFYDSHLFLHPSETGPDGNQEGVPNSMLEAMASGLPVFATNHGGIPEAVENGASGVLVAERDHAALAGALIDWVARPENLSRLAKRGEDSVTENFEQRSQTRKLEGFYAEAIGNAADWTI